MDWSSILPAQGQDFGATGTWFVILVIWSLIWKGLALWRAAKRDDKVWYVILLILNTVGILEIIYLLVTKGKKETKVEKIEKEEAA